MAMEIYHVCPFHKKIKSHPFLILYGTDIGDPRIRTSKSADFGRLSESKAVYDAYLHNKSMYILIKLWPDGIKAFERGTLCF